MYADQSDTKTKCREKDEALFNMASSKIPKKKGLHEFVAEKTGRRDDDGPQKSSKRCISTLVGWQQQQHVCVFVSFVCVALKEGGGGGLVVKSAEFLVVEALVAAACRFMCRCFFFCIIYVCTFFIGVYPRFRAFCRRKSDVWRFYVSQMGQVGVG